MTKRDSVKKRKLHILKLCFHVQNHIILAMLNEVKQTFASKQTNNMISDMTNNDMIALLQLSTTIWHRKSSVKENLRTEKILLQEKGELSEIKII